MKKGEFYRTHFLITFVALLILFVKLAMDNQGNPSGRNGIIVDSPFAAYLILIVAGQFFIFSPIFHIAKESYRNSFQRRMHWIVFIGAGIAMFIFGVRGLLN